MSECVFCEIVAETARASLVRRWTDAVAFKPLNPVTDGHVLVVPRQHVTDVREQSQVAALTMERAASLISGWTQDVNIITSAGPAATMTVQHLHLHVVPRREGDGLTLPWTGQQTAADAGDDNEENDLDVLDQLCTMCSRPFSPTHDIHAPGPTTRHPFTPRRRPEGVRS